MNTLTEIQQAKQWFEDRGISCYECNENYFDLMIRVDGYDIMISHSEISYRAELFKEENETI